MLSGLGPLTCLLADRGMWGVGVGLLLDDQDCKGLGGPLGPAQPSQYGPFLKMLSGLAWAAEQVPKRIHIRTISLPKSPPE